MNLELEGRRCLVTGASSGIGRAIALALAAEGARVAIAGRDPGALGEVGAEFESRGYRPAVVCPGDLGTAAGVRAVAAKAVRELGAVDILVNNAGGSRPLGPDDGEQVWDESFALNFSAARRMAELLVPAMKEARWGRVINITGAIVYWNVNAASPAKAALQSWGKGLAAELAPFGITVNAIAPGRINSRQILTRLHPSAESRQKFIEENIPIGYFGEPRDVANVAAFLASPVSNYVTGIVVPVDGGLFRLSF